METSIARSHGFGPFITYRICRLATGRHLVATSRRHRKNLPPHEVESDSDATAAPATRGTAFHQFFAPGRLGWWVAVCFGIGSIHFLVGALAATWPILFPVVLRDATIVDRVFFVGSIFFTTAAWLQWLEVLNGDVATALVSMEPKWRWFGWMPHNLGYLACVVQIAGTILFNFNTWDAMLPDLSWREQDLLIWIPDMLGSICFLVASYLAYAEVSHGAASFAPHSVSWWIAVVNLAGSVAFQISALTALVGPSPMSQGLIFWSTLFTAIGALCFLIGAYLMIPELFDSN